MHEVRCSDCFNVSNVEYHTVALAGELPSYCPYCGSKNIRKSRVDKYWYDLAEGLGFGNGREAADAVYKLYQLWDTSEFRHFRDFVESVK